MSIFAFLFAASAHAASCPTAPAAVVRAHDVAVDGSVWMLLTAGDTTCWWSVDDQGDERLVARWGPDAGRRPIALAAMADGRAALVMEDASGWRITLRHPAGGSESLQIRLEEPPARIVAHPDLPLLGVAGLPDRGTVRVLLVDVAVERVLAAAMVDRSRGALHFLPGDPRLYLAGAPELTMNADGVRVVADGR